MNLLIFFVFLSSLFSFLKDYDEANTVIKKVSLWFTFLFCLFSFFPVFRSFFLLYKNPLGFFIMWFYQARDVIMDVDVSSRYRRNINVVYKLHKLIFDINCENSLFYNLDYLLSLESKVYCGFEGGFERIDLRNDKIFKSPRGNFCYFNRNVLDRMIKENDKYIIGNEEINKKNRYNYLLNNVADLDFDDNHEISQDVFLRMMTCDLFSKISFLKCILDGNAEHLDRTLFKIKKETFNDVFIYISNLFNELIDKNNIEDFFVDFLKEESIPFKSREYHKTGSNNYSAIASKFILDNIPDLYFFEYNDFIYSHQEDVSIINIDDHSLYLSENCIFSNGLITSDDKDLIEKISIMFSTLDERVNFDNIKNSNIIIKNKFICHYISIIDISYNINLNKKRILNNYGFQVLSVNESLSLDLYNPHDNLYLDFDVKKSFFMKIVSSFFMFLYSDFECIVGLDLNCYSKGNMLRMNFEYLNKFFNDITSLFNSRFDGKNVNVEILHLLCDHSDIDRNNTFLNSKSGYEENEIKNENEKNISLVKKKNIQDTEYEDYKNVKSCMFVDITNVEKQCLH